MASILVCCLLSNSYYEFVTNSCSQLQTQRQENFSLSLIFSLFSGRTFLTDPFTETPLPKNHIRRPCMECSEEEERANCMFLKPVKHLVWVMYHSSKVKDLVLQSRSLSSVGDSCLNHKIIVLSYPLLSCPIDWPTLPAALANTLIQWSARRHGFSSICSKTLEFCTRAMCCKELFLTAQPGFTPWA